MDDNISISQGPTFGQGYMPYFYQSGKFLLYDIASRHSNSAKSSQSNGYDFTSDLVPNRTGHLASQTVEDIILNGYFAIPKSDPETALISDKTHTSRLGLGDIIEQVRNRHIIYEKNMYQLEMSKCYAINSQLAVESARGGVSTSSKEAYGLTKNISELYLQQCQERRNLWADISKLKLNLPEQAQSYLSSYRKLSILEEGDEL